MKTLTTCGAILVDEAGNVLIVRRSDSDKHRPLQWDLPGGHVEMEETLEAALVREVGEETGIDISDDKAMLSYAVSDTFEDISVTWLFFVVRIPQSSVTLSYEHDQYRWTSIDEAIDEIAYTRKKNALQYLRDNNLIG